ncbi:ATP-dependent DNA helicase [Janibacter alkaliphilus]|uniref:DNA 3'-5' helicase n=1 Tax=Janibacter alkaliphilus TaxID=1069963 RepID=A0A852X9C8_9MICO|nr:ATP-dependent DNA helicase [Janibacter alkaliphilus]NYG37343.1 DNA helicase-2/ATP-dependent DNA helicase PcrA [Janibacter alkaliphilus]
MSEQLPLLHNDEDVATRRPQEPWIDAVGLSRALGQAHPPTAEQQAVIEAPLEPTLVVAGAGSGKTETMTARVVWLVANGFVQPDEVLGLTFTRKAAGELAERIGARLDRLAASGLSVPTAPADGLAAAPTVSTYHAYAGSVVREHALRLGHERDARLLSEAAAWQLAHEVVVGYDGPMEGVDWVESTVTGMVVALSGELAEHLRTPEEMQAHLRALADRWESVGERAEKAPTKGFLGEIPPLRARAAVLPIVARYREVKRARGVLDFADQMALAARLAQEVPQIGEQERDRFRVVLLDEFQDTSEAQLTLMTGLFAPHGRASGGITAVGDPHQSIYAWRGASATTLGAFAERFGARRLALGTSWRNDTSILEAANVVADELRAGAPVPVPQLSARPDAPRGEVTVARVATAAEEADLVARFIAERRGQRRTAAVLCRKRSQFTSVVEALVAHDLPYEVVGLGGLLLTSEVSDVVALLSVVQDPARGDRLMRLLTGPTCRLGAADIAGLGGRARELSPRRDRSAGTDLAPDSADGVTIVDALDDLPAPGWQGPGGETISETALTRLAALAGTIRQLRGLAGLPLPDLVGEAERALGVDIEVLARPGWSPGAARAHLDAFADVAAGFAAGADRPTLGGFVDWVEAAIEQERGLDKPVVDPTPEAVQVLTCHAAKGLEWDVVAVPGLVEGTFPAHSARVTPDKETGGWKIGSPTDRGWLAGVDGGVPYPLRGDRAGLPELDVSGATPKEVTTAIEDFRRAGGEHAVVEERRLAYVALTRARHDLLLVSAQWASAQAPRMPSRFFTEVAALPGVTRRGELPADAMPDGGETNPAFAELHAVPWPPETPAAPADEVAALERARGRFEEQTSPGTAEPAAVTSRYAALDAQITALLAEREERRRGGDVEIALPAHLSTSDLVALAADRAAFAAELRRPMPRRPQPAGRRGTAFHAWVEEHYGRAAMVDVLELPGSADADLDDGELAGMQRRFLDSPWAQRTPLEVELSLETVVAGRAVRGRVDAVFRDEDGGVTVVDWKTGVPPTGAQARARAVQLSAYVLAYARWAELPVDRVRAAFFYAGTGETRAPELLGEDEIAALLTG